MLTSNRSHNKLGNLSDLKAKGWHEDDQMWTVSSSRHAIVDQRRPTNACFPPGDDRCNSGGPITGRNFQKFFLLGVVLDSLGIPIHARVPGQVLITMAAIFVCRLSC